MLIVRSFIFCSDFLTSSWLDRSWRLCCALLACNRSMFSRSSSAEHDWPDSKWQTTTDDGTNLALTTLPLHTSHCQNHQQRDIEQWPMKLCGASVLSGTNTHSMHVTNLCYVKLLMYSLKTSPTMCHAHSLHICHNELNQFLILWFKANNEMNLLDAFYCSMSFKDHAFRLLALFLLSDMTACEQGMMTERERERWRGEV